MHPSDSRASCWVLRTSVDLLGLTVAAFDENFAHASRVALDLSRQRCPDVFRAGLLGFEQQVAE